MRETFRSFFVVVVLCLLTGRATASNCYPDYCQKLTDLPTPGFSCLVTPARKGEDCAKQKFDNINSTKGDSAVFTLHAYVTNLLRGKIIIRNQFVAQMKATAFNLSISNINFQSLTMRYQNINNEIENVCSHIELYGNSTHPAPKDLYVSCPFKDEELYRNEDTSYRLECLIIGKNYVYTKKYIFYVLRHWNLEDKVHIGWRVPFIYVDVSESSNLVLYIQQFPSEYNVTEYEVILVKNDTKSVIRTVVLASENGGHIRYNFSPPDGIYYVKVAALHPKCSKWGCPIISTPYIHINREPFPDRVSSRLLIMIISLIWILPVVLYALYHAFKVYRRMVLKRIATRPNCLLIYSPTHPAHINVMGELAKYLRCCNINAMIDMFDIANTATKDPGLWCNTAFQTADVVLVATSPPTSGKSDVTIIYQNIDNHLLRLLKENYPQRNKRYFALHLPYCKSDHIPEEARLFKKFRMPEDLAKLVNTIYGIGCLQFLAASDGELLESIRFAAIKIFEDESMSTTKNVEETDYLLPPIIIQESKDCDADRPIKDMRCPDTPDFNVIP